jgi:potassium efflux system protein
MSQLLSRKRGGWLDRLRYVLYGLLVLLPFSLAVLSAAGWHYTADELYGRMWWTLAIVLVTLLVGALLVRGLFVLRRRLALEEARRRAAEKEAAAKEAAEKGETEADAPPPAPREEMDVSLYSITQETRRMIMGLLAFGLVIGLWFTWADVLPAFGFLERVTLWTTTEVAADDAAGVPAEINRITLANIGLAFLIIVMTVVAARNIPGVLRITLLQRLPLDRGVRFAITSICRYLIGIIGGVIAFGAIGIGWAQVQWLIAAATVGLGFGLQEIFANFVSGLIILFERPMRVGDIVTVGEVSGTVTRIRIRATTITDWDRKELIVPNREFITGQLINWSLSETTLRLSIEVGVAYGSDIEKVKRTLLRVAAEHPAILEEPAPAVHFTEFAGSSLNFALRVFVPDFEKYWGVRNELHEAINKAFREAEIEIPFSQHDLHIRSSSHELPVKMSGQPPQGSAVPEDQPDTS